MPSHVFCPSPQLAEGESVVTSIELPPIGEVLGVEVQWEGVVLPALRDWEEDGKRMGEIEGGKRWWGGEGRQAGVWG